MGPLTQRERNRATLARQLLLEPAELPALGAVEHLAGLQAQTPHGPYVSLFSNVLLGHADRGRFFDGDPKAGEYFGEAAPTTAPCSLTASSRRPGR